MPKVMARQAWAPQLLTAHREDQPECPPAALGPQGGVSLGRVDWQGPCTCVLGLLLWLVRRSKPGNKHPARSYAGRSTAGQVCAILLAAPAWARCEVEPEGLPESPEEGPKDMDSASTFLFVGMSLIHVLPVTATTSSHPLRELFLTDLCISYMRKTSTSVLVRFTGKCCNRAQLSTINHHRAAGEAHLSNTV